MKKLLTLFVLMLVFAGCSNNTGKKFVGKWETEDTNPKKIEIVANGGKNYAIKGFVSFWDGSPEEIIAVLDNDTLVVKTIDSREITPFMTSYFILKYNKANDIITFKAWGGEALYTRSK